MSIGYIRPVSVPRDPEDREPDEPINLYFGEEFSITRLAPEYTQIPCPDSIESFVFFLEMTDVPYKVVFTSRPEFVLVQYMYRTEQIYPFSVGESKLNVVRENSPDGIALGEYFKQEYRDGDPDFFDESEFSLYESEKEIDDDGEVFYGNENGKIPAIVMLYSLELYGIAANYIRAHLTHDDLMRLDRNNGILFSVDNDGQLSHRIVSGAERPDLTAVIVKDGNFSVEKCRPYYEDSEMGKTLDSALGIGQTFPFMLNDDEDDVEFDDDLELDDVLEMAEDGDIEMMGRLMQAYIRGDAGLGIEEDPEKACYWMEKLAEEGESIGAFNLGLHYAKGYGVPRDFDEAARWMDKAAELGDEDAPPVAENYREMADNLRKAEAGDAQAQADVAAEFMRLGGSLNEAGPAEDYKESLKWAKKAAAQNNGDGIWTLALAYEHGRGVKQDVEKAIALYRQGVEIGHARSMHSLGCYYARGDHMEEDLGKAFGLFMRAAELGDGLAMEAVGNGYQYGKGTPGNLKKAAEWYEKAAEVQKKPQLAERAADIRAEFESDPSWGKDFSEIHTEDEDEDGDNTFIEMYKQKIRRLIITGKLSGNADFFERLMCMHREEKSDTGIRVLLDNLGAISSYLLEKDRITQEELEETFERIRNSAQQGDPNGMRALARCYEFGVSVEADFDKAVEWYEKNLQVEPDNVSAMNALALTYMDRGEEGDKEAMAKCLYWFKQAADKGDDMCLHQYAIWSYVTKHNDGLIPEDFDMGSFVRELSEAADNGDEEAAYVLDTAFDEDKIRFLTEDEDDEDDEDDGEQEQLLNMFLTRMIGEGRLSGDVDYDEFMDCLQEEADKGDEIAQALLQNLLD